MYVPAYRASALSAKSFGSRSRGRPIEKGAEYVPAAATVSVVGVAMPPKAPRRRPGRPITPSPDSSSPADASRSEEHTSELQSPCNLVCRLLLEKKKKN